jgi:hypothetical protein
MVFHELSKWDRHEQLRRLGLVALRIHDYHNGRNNAELPHFDHQQNLRIGDIKQKLVHVQRARSTYL